MLQTYYKYSVHLFMNMKSNSCIAFIEDLSFICFYTTVHEDIN